MLGYIVVGLVVGLCVYAALDMQRVAVRRYSVQGRDRLKVLQFSDLHKRSFGRGNARLVDLVRRERPDLVVFTGDLVSRDQTDFSDVESLIKEVCGLTRVYYSVGNHEVDMPAETYRALSERFGSYGATLLDGSSVYVADHTRLWGLTLPLECYHDGSHHYGNLYHYTAQDATSQLGTPNPDDCNVLLAHNPFFFDSYAEWGADLTLCGHVHGGIVRLPFVNGLLSPERRLFPKYAGGLYRRGGRTMVVSRGLGKLRLFNPPEASVVLLTEPE